MRKVTEKAAKAMRQGENMTSGNTRVHSDGSVMELHGNTIAIYDRLEQKLTLRDSGWKSATTKERLNGVLDVFGVGAYITQKNHTWYVVTASGQRYPWGGHLTVEV